MAFLLLVLLSVMHWCYGPLRVASNTELQGHFASKRAVVCGASYGIGAEIAYALARANASLLITARSQDKLEKVAATCRALGAAEVTVHATDLSTRANCRGLIARADEALGGVDLLVLNHIIGFYEDWPARLMRAHAADDGGETLDRALAFSDKIMAVNVNSYIHISSYALPALARSEGGGRIVAVGSAAGKQGLPRVAPYSASKHAVFGYFDSLRQDLVASKDAALRAITVTQGVLGSFNTTTAREGTKGYLDEGFVNWHPPSEAASVLLTGAARRLRTVYTPWEQVRMATLLRPLMPTFLDWTIRLVTLSGETINKE